MKTVFRVMKSVFRKKNKAESNIDKAPAETIIQTDDTQVLTIILDEMSKPSLLRGVDRDNLALCRKSVLREYSVFMKGLTQSQKAQLLVDYANAMGWTNQVFISGTRFKEMSQSDRVPGWVVSASFELLLQRGWLPRLSNSSQIELIQPFEDTFALFIHYWITHKGPFSSIEQVLASLPDGIDLEMASLWARFFVGRIGRSNAWALSCFLVDQSGQQIGKRCKTFRALARKYEKLDDQSRFRLAYTFSPSVK